MHPTLSYPPSRRLNDGPECSHPSYKIETNKLMSATKDASTKTGFTTTLVQAATSIIKNKSRRLRRRRKPRYGNTNIQLPADFQPTESAVLCGRSRQSFDWEGNKKLRQLVKTFVNDYVKTKDKQEKSDIVSNVVQIVRIASPEGAFVKQIDGRWFEVGDAYAREKVGAQFREFLHTQYRSSVKSKLERKRKRKEEDQRKQKDGQLVSLQCRAELSISSRRHLEEGLRVERFSRRRSNSSNSSNFSDDEERSSGEGTENLANTPAAAHSCQRLKQPSVGKTDDNTAVLSTTQQMLTSYHCSDLHASFCHGATDMVDNVEMKNMLSAESIPFDTMDMHILSEPPLLPHLSRTNDDELVTSPLLTTNNFTIARPTIESSADVDMDIIDQQLIEEIAPYLENIAARGGQEQEQLEDQQTTFLSFFDVEDQSPMMFYDGHGGTGECCSFFLHH